MSGGKMSILSKITFGFFPRKKMGSPAVKRESAQVHFPCALNAANFRSLVNLQSNIQALPDEKMFPKLAAYPFKIGLSYVLRGTKNAAVGNLNTDHNEIVSVLSGGINPVLANSASILGGYLMMGVSKDRKKAAIYVDGIAPHFGLKDARPMADLLSEILVQSGFKVKSDEKVEYPHRPPSYVLTLEDTGKRTD